MGALWAPASFPGSEALRRPRSDRMKAPDTPPRIQVKRAYEAPAPEDGARVLIDRLWPRGLTKEKARLDAWRKELAPSEELRRWFGHDPTGSDASGHATGWSCSATGTPWRTWPSHVNEEPSPWSTRRGTRNTTMRRSSRSSSKRYFGDPAPSRDRSRPRAPLPAMGAKDGSASLRSGVPARARPAVPGRSWGRTGVLEGPPLVAVPTGARSGRPSG